MREKVANYRFDLISLSVWRRKKPAFISMTNNYILQKGFYFMKKKRFFFLHRKFGKMLVERKWMHSGRFWLFFLFTIFHRISHTRLLQIVHYYWSGVHLERKKKWKGFIYVKDKITFITWMYESMISVIRFSTSITRLLQNYRFNINESVILTQMLN